MAEISDHKGSERQNRIVTTRGVRWLIIGLGGVGILLALGLLLTYARF